jgi:hypothetical protein
MKFIALLFGGNDSLSQPAVYPSLHPNNFSTDDRTPGANTEEKTLGYQTKRNLNRRFL